MMSKSYSELITLPTREERLEYLKIGGAIGAETFGVHRYLNQVLYKSPEWKKFRRDIILRDNGCDLALEGWQIDHSIDIRIHHIVPITIEDIEDRADCIFDPENVVTTYFKTHQYIHFGEEDPMKAIVVDRKPGDTKLW